MKGYKILLVCLRPDFYFTFLIGKIGSKLNLF
nr:MAG TPA: hypothetical protein [Caudoviricetes sp.]DAX31550.1 MAG TPA: hypothetical protein [Caudoviricetes sp.]